MTATPDTTARTETAGETDSQFIAEMRDRADVLDRKYGAANAPEVGMLRRSADALSGDVLDMAAIGRSFMASLETVTSGEGPYKGWTPAEDPAELVLDLYNDLEEERAVALASPQHPVGVREALFDHHPDFLEDPEAGKEPSIREMVTAYYREHLGEGDAKFYADRYVAALSHPPAQDAPGAEAIAALARGYELMQRVIWNMAGTSGPDAAWYRQQAQAVTDRVDALWKVEAGSNPSRPGDCLTQADKFLAALDPSPPLPKADGEVVAWRVRYYPDAEWFVSNERRAKVREAEVQEPLVRQSALVSALREKGEALIQYAAQQDYGRIIGDRFKTSDAAREKAEQVAAGLREELAEANRRLAEEWANMDATMQGWDALCARTDEIEAACENALVLAAEDERDRLTSLAFDQSLHDHPYKNKSWAEAAKCWLKDNGAMFPSERAALRASTEGGGEDRHSVRDGRGGGPWVT